MNIYSDSLYTAVNFLSDKTMNIPNLLYMRENFNVRDAEWDLFISLYSAASHILRNLADSYCLVCSIAALSIPTH